MKKLLKIISKKTGKEEFLDPSKVKDLSHAIHIKEIISPEDNMIPIKIKMHDIKDTLSILISGNLNYKNKNYVSKDFFIGQYKFAEELLSAIEEDKTVNDMPSVKDSIEKIRLDLSYQLISSHLNID